MVAQGRSTAFYSVILSGVLAFLGEFSEACREELRELKSS